MTQVRQPKRALDAIGLIQQIILEKTWRFESQERVLRDNSRFNNLSAATISNIEKQITIDRDILKDHAGYIDRQFLQYETEMRQIIEGLGERLDVGQQTVQQTITDLLKLVITAECDESNIAALKLLVQTMKFLTPLIRYIYYGLVKRFQ